MRNTLFLKIIATTLVFGALLVFYPATIILGTENSSQFTGLWKRQSSGAPLGLAYSSDGRNYVAFLRPLTCITGPETTIENWVCRIRFSLYDTCPPGPRAFIIAPSSIARPMGVSQGRGDWEGYKPACYDQGAITDGQAHILKAGWEWFALIDWRVRWMKNKEPRQAANSSLLSLLPADKEQAESIARTMGLRGDTPEWLDFQTVLKELKNQRYRLVTGKTAARQPADPEKVTVMLRHDVDVSLYGAQIMAFEEALHAIPAVFCINLGSSIYGLTGNNGVYIHRPGALEDLLTLQQLGHIISSRTDSLVMQGIYATPLSNWRNAEHQRMLAAGVQDIALPLSNSVTHPLRTIADTQAGQGTTPGFSAALIAGKQTGRCLGNNFAPATVDNQHTGIRSFNAKYSAAARAFTLIRSHGPRQGITAQGPNQVQGISWNFSSLPRWRPPCPDRCSSQADHPRPCGPGPDNNRLPDSRNPARSPCLNLQERLDSFLV